MASEEHIILSVGENANVLYINDSKKEESKEFIKPQLCHQCGISIIEVACCSYPCGHHLCVKCLQRETAVLESETCPFCESNTTDDKPKSSSLNSTPDSTETLKEETTTCNAEDSKKGKQSWLPYVLGGAAVGAVSLVAAPLVVLPALGFTAGGIASGSIAAGMMSSAAIANGGGIAAGSMVAVLQSAGAAGVAASTSVALGAGGATVGAGAGAGIGKLVDALKKDEVEKADSCSRNDSESTKK